MRNGSNVAPPRGPLSPTEMRAKVEEAKQLYKAQKDSYRQERARRREKERAAHGEIPVDMQPSTSSSSHEPEATWATYPQYGFPKRAHTHIGHGVRRHGYKHEENARAHSRIVKKLADMGFSENSHPDLSEKIAALLPTGLLTSKNREDDIVTTLLEELIPVSAPPSHTASGRKNDVIPGAWQ